MGKITDGAPQQRKDEPSSEVDGLWSLIITRCLEGNITNHHYFVIDVVESCLPSSMFCTLVSFLTAQVSISFATTATRENHLFVKTENLENLISPASD